MTRRPTLITWGVLAALAATGCAQAGPAYNDDPPPLASAPLDAGAAPGSDEAVSDDSDAAAPAPAAPSASAAAGTGAPGMDLPPSLVVFATDAAAPGGNEDDAAMAQVTAEVGEAPPAVLHEAPDATVLIPVAGAIDTPSGPSDAANFVAAPEAGDPAQASAQVGAIPGAAPSADPAGGVADPGAPLDPDAETEADAGAGDPSEADPAADTATPPGSPQPGDLLITEIMFYPSGSEPESEWFEVYNTTGGPLDLNGVTIQDGYPRVHVIASGAPVIAPPGQYVVLVRSRESAVASDVPDESIVYEYGAGLASNEGIQLENGATGALSLWSGGVALVAAPYGPWGLASIGSSIELASLQTFGDQATDWCVAASAWAAGSDFGTPGAAGDCP